MIRPARTQFRWGILPFYKFSPVTRLFGLTCGLLLLLTACSGGGSGSSDPPDEAPVITLLGSSVERLALGDSYTDPGATANDLEDGDLTEWIVTDSTLNTAVAGSYLIRYSVSDSAGNTTTAERAIFVLDLSVDNFQVSWLNDFSLPPQDSDGWSILTPSADSRLIYVSSSSGDDTTAQVYLPAAAEIGSDPFDPAGTIMPFATLQAAQEQLRDGYPDYLLLKRGDSWTPGQGVSLGKGRSVTERMVVAAYGDLSVERPLVKNSGVYLNRSGNAAVIGVHFYSADRNPAEAEFVGFANVDADSGISATLYSDTGGLLIEDCRFEWFNNNVVQSYAFDADDNLLPVADIIIRRNIFTDNYSVTSHSQGLYSAYSSVLLEDNIFDHNGWYQQGNASTKTAGMATMFNHNTYFTEARNTVFRNNIFLRASSIGTKFTSNTTTGTNQIKAWNILVDNNFYAEGEIGISLGGNKDQDNGPRWENILVTDNVMTGIGRTFPTNRTLGWGIEISDWQSGLVFGNLLTHWGQAGVYTNTWGIKSGGHTTDTLFDANIVYDLVSSLGLLTFTDAGAEQTVNGAQDRIVVRNNELASLEETNGRLIDYPLALTDQKFADNYYYFAKDQAQWFAAGGSKISLSDFLNLTADTTSTAELRDYVDPERSIGSYLAELGYASGLTEATEIDALVERLNQQRKGNWDGHLSATAINGYLRSGFCINGNSLCR